MENPFIGTIIMFGGTYAPLNWAFCDGSIYSIAEYDALYSLIGTTYGGDGQSTFAVPDLRGRIPVNQGQGSGLSNYVIGQIGGTESVSLLPVNLPQHSHGVISNSGAATSTNPANSFLGTQSQLLEYNPGASANAVMAAASITPSTGGQAHNNIMPTLAVNYVIAMNGIYPQQN